jgi:hypothetical protein
MIIFFLNRKLQKLIITDQNLKQQSIDYANLNYINEFKISKG